MAIQKVINHIYTGSDYDIEHAQTGADMVVFGNNKLSDFLQYMLPITGGIEFNGNIYLNKELIIKDYYNSNSKSASVWFNGRDGGNFILDRVNELQINTGGIKCKTHIQTQWGFLQNLPNGSTPLIEGRDGGAYGLGWYFSNAKGAFIDLYAKNVQNQCDARVKDIIPQTKEIKVTPNPIENITPKRYKYHGEEKIRFGFIAQEIENYIPEAVTTLKYDPTETNIPVDKFGNKILDCRTVDLMALVATLWQEVKDLKEEIKVIKSK